MTVSLRSSVSEHLHVLVEEIGARPAGSPRNARACSYAAGVLQDAGLQVLRAAFTTRWWEPGPGSISWDCGRLDVLPDPYSPPCSLTAALVEARTLEAITTARCEGRAVLVSGEIVAGPVTPLAFPFFSDERGAALVAALTAAHPAVVIAASEHWGPVFEDASLPFPSVTVTPDVGRDLAASSLVTVRLGGAVHEGHGVTVSGLTSGTVDRMLVSAHIDTKATTAGAFDNAAGVAVLLAVAEHGLLPDLPVEVVLFNGEDHYDACGELAWLRRTDLAKVRSDVNLDGLGLRGRRCQVSAFGGLESDVRSFVEARESWVMGEPWYESDHTIFTMRGLPAVALTSEKVHDMLASLAHTSEDTLDVLDLDLLADVARSLPELLEVVWRATVPAAAT